MTTQHNFGHMAAGVSKMQHAENEIRDDLNKLKNIAVEISTDSWSGTAAVRFAQLMADWDRNGNELMGALAKIHEQLKATGRDLEFTRDVTRDMFNTELPDFRDALGK
ncbi:hypothetical protein Val02_58890 [Virgisporangium aliadipatigenens]|uniref:ESAT-6-like protein n=1 Tax=Virgisporangium aliadipatigenens TaxID=741659 RepID=A0A8J4DTH8_9ACTN|nr:WXG100 family type VII secretion target [Virgisporangium aliadipatigenens]GIJ49003.1 hypothetical protein Val02_58890 [Virgisporangium aliadipatigenens]